MIIELFYSYLVFFGLQYIVKKWLVGEVLNQAMIDEADLLLNKHFRGTKVFNKKGDVLKFSQLFFNVKISVIKIFIK